jgi:hypothetical protein
MAFCHKYRLQIDSFLYEIYFLQCVYPDVLNLSKASFTIEKKKEGLCSKNLKDSLF